MKFTSIIAAAFAFAQSVVALRSVKLKTFGYPPPQFPDVTGKFVTSWSGGDGSSFMVVVEEKDALIWTYDEDTKYLYYESGAGTKYCTTNYFTIAEGNPAYLLTSINGTPVEVTIDNWGFITFDGSYGVKGVKNINDPHQFSACNYLLVKYDGVAPDGAVPIFFQAIDA